MSALPEIDEVKAAHRELGKLREQIAAATNREARLEILAEALRDERDAARARVSELEAEKTQKDESV
jgi:hypothetical protein